MRRAFMVDFAFQRYPKGSLAICFHIPAGVFSLIPYALLLSQRSTAMDSGQKLALYHVPDLQRFPELLGLGMIALLVYGALCRKVNWRAPENLFAASFALMPFIVFNQQVITGRSLQPFHYEAFIANYSALVAAILVAVTVWRGTEPVKQRLSQRIVARVFFIAILWGVIEVVAPTKLIVQSVNIQIEQRRFARDWDSGRKRTRRL